MTMPSTTTRTRLRVFHVQLVLVGVAVALQSESLQENLGCLHQKYQSSCCVVGGTSTQFDSFLNEFFQLCDHFVTIL